MIEISDDGFGIGRNMWANIRKVLPHRHSPEQEGGGSGLGLAICKHIIEAHDQAIHVRSTLDVGTTFGFTLQSKKD